MLGFVEADKRGDARAIEQAAIGSVYGLTFVECLGIDAGASIAYHSSAFAFGSMSPVGPSHDRRQQRRPGGGSGPLPPPRRRRGRLSTLSVVSTFTGAGVVTEADGSIKRAVKVATAAGLALAPSHVIRRRSLTIYARAPVYADHEREA